MPFEKGNFPRYIRGVKVAAFGVFQCGSRDDSKILNEFLFVPQNSISGWRRLKKGDGVEMLER